MPTISHVITSSAWVEIGSGPMVLETKHNQNAYLHFGEAAPALESDAFHDLIGPSSFAYGGSAKCYARAAHGEAKIIATGQA